MRTRWVLAVAYLVVFGGLLYWLWGKGGMAVVESLPERGGALVHIVFVLLYLVFSLFFLPINWLNVLSGALFGPVQGAAMILLAVSVSASAAFWLGRYVMSPERMMARIPERAAIVHKLMDERHSWKTLLLVRLSHLAPYALVNYLAGLMPIRFGPYLAATLIGSLPGTLVYSGLGALLMRLLNIG